MIPPEYHLSPQEFVKKYSFGFSGATAMHSCTNCCYSGYTSRYGFHCQHPEVRVRLRTTATGTIEALDAPLSLDTGRDAVCGQFSPVTTAERLAEFNARGGLSTFHITTSNNT